MNLHAFRRSLVPQSCRACLLASVLLFSLAAYLLLSNRGPEHWISWSICIGCVVLIFNLANGRRISLRNAISRYFLFVFLIFLTAEELAFAAGAWAGGPQWTWWLRILAAVVVATGAGLWLPRLRSIREASAREHARFLAAAENTLDDFYIFDGVTDAAGSIVDFRFSYINPNAERRLRVRREDLIGKILTEVRPFMITSGLIEKYVDVVQTGVPFTTEVYIDDEMIQSTWLNVQVVKLGEGIAITSRDVTESKRLTERNHHLAHHDHLTGLANRNLLYDRLQQAILRAHRDDCKVAVFLVDIDHFKHINDSLGHADGDALLAAVARRLLDAVRETDTVARFGGDEFVIVMSDFHDISEVECCGIKIVENAARPILLGQREVAITISAGVCICPDAGSDAAELLRKADLAMYAVKDSGRNSLRIFGPGFLGDSGNLLELEDSHHG